MLPEQNNQRDLCEDRLLLVLAHGNNAGPEDWLHIEESMRKRMIESGRKLFVLRAQSNSHDTKGGIEFLGRRLADEIISSLSAILVGIHALFSAK